MSTHRFEKPEQIKKENYYYYYFFFLNKFIYLFSFGCVGSSFLCEGFLQLRRARATLHRGARASHCHSLSCCGAQAPDTQAQQLWLTGSVAPLMWDLPRPGLEPVSPALAGRFLTTAPPGKPPENYFKKISEKHPKGEKDKSNRLTAGLSAAMEARRQWNSKILNP